MNKMRLPRNISLTYLFKTPNIDQLVRKYFNAGVNSFINRKVLELVMPLPKIITALDNLFDQIF